MAKTNRKRVGAIPLDTNLKAPVLLFAGRGAAVEKTIHGPQKRRHPRWEPGGPAPIPHSISKAGVIMLTKCLAKELAPEVRVNAIAPGTITLPDDAPELEASFIRQAPLDDGAGPTTSSKLSPISPPQNLSRATPPGHRRWPYLERLAVAGNNHQIWSAKHFGNLTFDPGMHSLGLPVSLLSL